MQGRRDLAPPGRSLEVATTSPAASRLFHGHRYPMEMIAAIIRIILSSSLHSWNFMPIAKLSMTPGFVEDKY